MHMTLDKKNLIDFINPAKNGKLVLPEFQRNFVWSRDDIKDLLVSILKGYFIGSILIIRVDEENIPFEMRAIEGVGKKVEELKPDFMILDGQQRLTALYYVMEAPKINLKSTKYPYRFYLDLNKLLENQVDEAVWSERSDLCTQYEDKEYQFNNNIIPFTKILEWNDWTTEYTERLAMSDHKELIDFIRSTKPKWETWIKNITEAETPIIEIPKVANDDEQGISEVCAIFEKMNSTGVKLTVFDLLTARLYKYRDYKINLHKWWENAIVENINLRELSQDSDSYSVFALRFIALKRGLEVKSKTLINLKPDNFDEDWSKAIDYLEKALSRIRSTNEDGFGAFSMDWMPYSTMVPVLAALLWKIDELECDFRSYKYIQKWYWSSVFLERYAGAVETTTKKDFDDLVRGFSDKSFTPEVFEEADREILNNPRFTLQKVNRVNSIYKGVMNLIALEGAKDFRADDSIEFHILDDHHIFPKAYLNITKDEFCKERYNKQMMNCILNRTLISAKTNRFISGSKPSDYLNEIVPSEKRDNIMRSHLIDEKALDRLENNDFEGFIEAREKRILYKLREKLNLT